MAGRSSIERDPEVRAAVDEALAAGATLDEIVAAVRATGGSVSRSAVGRYAQSYREIADQQRDMQAIAKAFANDFGGAGDNQGRMLIQLGTSILTRFAMSEARGETDEMGKAKALADFAKAVKDLTSAAKVDADRDARVREEARKQAKLEAADEAVAAARSTGASDETVRRVRAQILGIEA